MLYRSALLFIGLTCGAAAQAQSVVYRCPGPPVLYTDALTPKEAQDKGCRSIEGTPITVLQGQRPRAPAPTAPGASAEPRSGDGRVDPAQQRSRDGERRKVLETELRESEERLAALQREYQGGQPERRGDERNFQKYLDRVAELKTSITRQENDIQALKREISKLP
ncbi:hypothetical protein PEC18_13060 [Paucibacter sp. O1-1]|uniref:hypothetical protein n=1 Tax=Paucibacter sp. XJ19-41 TaxID=2927824 RepID=UPI0021D4F7D7|nr:hypothetical protein [Paucibacter sp. XJ19-41]MCU7371758.1 hypothetical protein [Paucibacter sp. O1-1]MDA3826748.1 hypothetical protein [Paucibacter sp. O1-1]MDC6166367.1 hypothetical protein [Paucibacter sp. XJ19-41]